MVTPWLPSQHLGYQASSLDFSSIRMGFDSGEIFERFYKGSLSSILFFCPFWRILSSIMETLHFKFVIEPALRHKSA